MHKVNRRPCARNCSQISRQLPGFGVSNWPVLGEIHGAGCAGHFTKLVSKLRRARREQRFTRERRLSHAKRHDSGSGQEQMVQLFHGNHCCFFVAAAVEPPSITTPLPRESLTNCIIFRLPSWRPSFRHRNRQPVLWLSELHAHRTHGLQNVVRFQCRNAVSLRHVNCISFCVAGVRLVDDLCGQRARPGARRF